MELVEPLRLLFKDEVRKVGAELGLPERMVWRQPFPGPGLAIRIIGEVTLERLVILRAADAVLQEEIRKAGLYRDLWQSFAVLPAIKSVAVQGDERTYAYPIVIRAVTSEDAMTADWARIPYDVLETISSRIINEVEGVNRVAPISRRSRRQRSSGSERRAVLPGLGRPAAGPLPPARLRLPWPRSCFVCRSPPRRGLALRRLACGRAAVHRPPSRPVAPGQRGGRGPCHLHAPRRAVRHVLVWGAVDRSRPARRAAGGLSVRLRGRAGEVSR